MGSIPVSVFGTAALLVCLWLLSFPFPFDDDLCMCGAALNMATGGDFSNPLIARLGFPSHYFFAQPPTQSYALAGWLKIFGISAGSLTGFQITMYFLTAAAAIAILRRHSAPGWLEWLAGLGVVICLPTCGLRMEPLAIALTMVGFGLIECGLRHRFAVFFAFLLMFLGGSAAPRTVFFSAAFVLLAIWRLARSAPTFRTGLLFACICATIALTVTILLFLWMIDFRLQEFLATFRFSAQKRIELDHSVKEVFIFLLDHTVRIQWPLLLLPFVVLCLNLLRGPNRLTQLDGITICVLVPYVFVALAGFISIYMLWFPVFGLLAGIASMLQYASKGKKLALQAALCLLLLVDTKTMAIQAFGIITHNIKLDTGPSRAEALAMRSTPGHQVIVDTWVARYVFGYRIPSEFIAFEFCGTLGGPIQSNLQEGDVCLVSSWDEQVLLKATHLQMPKPPVWAPFGIQRWSCLEYPCHVYIIPAASCIGVRKDANL